MRHPVNLLLLAVLAAGMLTGCTADQDPTSRPTQPTSEPTPLSAYDTGSVVVARSAFCDRISAEALRDALGVAPDDARAWEPGEELEATGAPADVVDEFGCEWTTEDGLAAAAWLFAPPVTPARAQALLDGQPACWNAEGEAFGGPSAAIRCSEPQQRTGRVELGHRGLFGDAWLTCTLSAPAGQAPVDLVHRADRWCVQVVEAVRVR